jgi:hypothetical protein
MSAEERPFRNTQENHTHMHFSAHDIPPTVDHFPTCSCFLCYCLKREKLRAGRPSR